MPVQQMNSQQRKTQPLFKKMNAEEEALSINQRLDLETTHRGVQRMMGPEPVPSLDIQMDEIQNELQRKMVEEIQCVVCFQFPYKPLECRKCNKLFCKYCQLQLGQIIGDESSIMENAGGMGGLMGRMEKKLVGAGRDQDYGIKPTGENLCCPNCGEGDDFMQDVNKVLKNCIDFCEFPHKCFTNDGRGEIIWKTLNELQAHAQFNCPKFGCDVCYREEYQHMTRGQLYEHIQKDCPQVLIMCQVCNKEYFRAEFANHQCIKDFYLEKLRQMAPQVIDNLADKFILHKRQKEGVGLCINMQCVEKHRNSGNQYQGSMIAQNQDTASSKCFRCKNVIAGYEDSYFCVYCNETYCPECLGYCKFYDLEEMEQLLLGRD